ADLEEDPEEDHADYPADGGDGDDEPSDDNNVDDETDDEDEEPFEDEEDNEEEEEEHLAPADSSIVPIVDPVPLTDDEDEEPFKDEEDNEEEEEHLAPADSSIVPIVDPVPLVGDTEAFETNESVPTHGSSQAIIPISQTRLHRARKTIRLEPPMSTSIEACIARHAAALTPSLPVPSPPLLLPSPLTTSPTDIGAPLGYRAAGIKMRALLPSTSHRTDIPQADMPPRKRAFLTTPAPRF
nr:hypothetical protein [Tanacetum cinerariifolium]